MVTLTIKTHNQGVKKLKQITLQKPKFSSKIYYIQTIWKKMVEWYTKKNVFSHSNKPIALFCKGTVETTKIVEGKVGGVTKQS